MQAIESLGGQSVQTIACEPVWFQLIPKQMRPRVPRRVNKVVVPAFGIEETYEADVLTQLRGFRYLQVVYLTMGQMGLTLSHPGHRLREERIEADLPNVHVATLIN